MTMAIDKKFLNLFTKATEKAAIGASKFIGKKDKIAADKETVDPMRRELNKINMQGTVVIVREKWMKLQCYILVKD